MRKCWSLVFAIILLFSFCRVSLGTVSSNRIVLNLPALILEYYEGDTLIKAYPVAVGRKTSQTPVGDFKVINKSKNPTWSPRGRSPIPPGPANPLGTRWIGFKNGYGIHGNNKPSVIGTLASAGCVRLYNEDVEELYEKVAVGTPVKVIYQTFEIAGNGQKPYIKAYPDLYGFGVNTRESIIAKLNEHKMVIPEKKLSVLFSNVNKKTVIFNEGYLMKFNGEIVTNDIEEIEQEFYINKQELEVFFGATCGSYQATLVEDKEYIPLKEVFDSITTNIEINEVEEIIDIQGNLITLNGKILNAGYIQQDYDTILIHIRPLAEALGWDVSWDNEIRTAFLNNNPLKTSLINSRSYMLVEELSLLLNVNFTYNSRKSMLNFYSW